MDYKDFGNETPEELLEKFKAIVKENPDLEIPEEHLTVEGVKTYLAQFARSKGAELTDQETDEAVGGYSPDESIPLPLCMIGKRCWNHSMSTSDWAAKCGHGCTYYKYKFLGYDCNNPKGYNFRDYPGFRNDAYGAFF